MWFLLKLKVSFINSLELMANVQRIWFRSKINGTPKHATRAKKTMTNKEKARERREKRMQEISLLRTIPYS